MRKTNKYRKSSFFFCDRFLLQVTGHKSHQKAISNTGDVRITRDSQEIYRYFHVTNVSPYNFNEKFQTSQYKSYTVIVVNFKITFMGENWHFPWLVLGMPLFKQQTGAETQHFCSKRNCMVCINCQPPKHFASGSLKNGGCQHFVIHLRFREIERSLTTPLCYGLGFCEVQ